MTHAEKEERNQKIVALRKQGYSMSQLQEMYGLKSVWHICKKYGVTGVMSDRKPEYGPERYADKRTEQEKKEIVESYLPKQFSYDSGYTNCDRHVNLRCNICGCVFDASMVSVRKNFTIKCPACEDRAKEEQRRIADREKKASEELRNAKKLQRQSEIDTYLFLHTYQVECVECGKVFVTRKSRQVCCSDECSKKHNNRICSKRKDKRIAKDKRIDKDINVKSLYAKDRGVCWICGGQCDLTDFVERDGVIICGNRYPSVDHVVAISDGGEDSWNNVRLAHRICNTKRFYDERSLPRSARL